MSENKTNWYDPDPHIAEWYDQNETYTDDIELIRHLISGHASLRILEPFCGTGRILIPLAQDGHELVGLDQSKCMLDLALAKIAKLHVETQQRIQLIHTDVTSTEWPVDFYLVILGANCLYELATPEEQEKCIAAAAASLKPGGYIYLDNNHMEGELDEAWCKPGINKGIDWTSPDGTHLERFGETIWFDKQQRLWKSRQTWVVTHPNGHIDKREFIQQKHPVSAIEQQEWLTRYGLVIEQLYGDRSGNPYTEASDRAIFWARKE